MCAPLDRNEKKVVVQFENPRGLSFRSAALSREESAVPLLAASRFLADKSGFGMTRVRLFSQTAVIILCSTTSACAKSSCQAVIVHDIFEIADTRSPFRLSIRGE